MKEKAVVFSIFLMATSVSVANARMNTPFASPTRFGLTTHLGAFAPTGYYGQETKTGYRWEAGFDYYAARNAAVGFDFSLGKSEAAAVVSLDVPITSITYFTYRLGIHGRYTLPIRSNISPYLEGGTGIYWNQRRVNGFVVDNSGRIDFTERSTNTTRGVHLGAGISALLNRRLNLLTGFQFHQLFDETPSRNYATLTMGLGFHLGRLQ